MVTIPRDDEILGLSEYEGRLYRALLIEHPATAYRLGKISGVPLSRVYGIADRLVHKGAANRLDGEPARYTPVPPASLLAGARARTESRLDALADELTALYTGEGSEGPAWLRGEQAVIGRAVELARGCRRELLAVGSPDALRALEPVLGECDSGVRVRVLSHPDGGREAAPFFVLADGSSALLGTMGRSPDALWTEHPTVASMCAEYFRLRAVADAAQDVLAGRRAVRQALDRPAGWLDWEEEKHRRLLQAH